jgi:hypothetical protein
MHADRQHRKLLLAQPSSAPSASASEDKKNAVAAKARGETRRSNRGALPAHLPRLDVTIEPEDSNCPCCRSPMHVIEEETSERLDMPGHPHHLRGSSRYGTASQSA